MLFLVIALGFLTMVMLFFMGMTRVGEIFVVSVLEGRTLLVRGFIEQDLFDAITRVIEEQEVPIAMITAARFGGAPRLEVSGGGDALADRLQELFEEHADGIGHGERAKNPNLGQRLGITWLAWAMAEKA